MCFIFKNMGVERSTRILRSLLPCTKTKLIGDQMLHFGEVFEYCFGPGRWEFE